MANADRNNVIKRSSLNRPLSFQEGDQNLDELINVIDDQQNFESQQTNTNGTLRQDIDSVESDVNGTGGVTDRVDVLENDLPKSAYSIIDIAVSDSNVTVGTNDAKANGFRLTGSLAGDISVIVPNTERMYTVVNDCTGDFAVTVKTALGTGVAVSQGQTFVVRCDGADVVRGLDSQRTIYVGSVAELNSLPSPQTSQQALVSGVPFAYNGTSWEPSDGYVTPEVFGNTGTPDDTTVVQQAIDYGYSLKVNNPHIVTSLDFSGFNGIVYGSGKFIAKSATNIFSIISMVDASFIEWMGVDVDMGQTATSTASDPVADIGFYILDARDISISNMEIHNVREGRPIAITGTSSTTPTASEGSKRIRVSSVTCIAHPYDTIDLGAYCYIRSDFYTSNGGGTYFNASNGVQVSDMTLDASVAYLPTTTDVFFTDCYFENHDRFQIINCDNVSLSNNVFKNFYTRGINAAPACRNISVNGGLIEGGAAAFNVNYACFNISASNLVLNNSGPRGEQKLIGVGNGSERVYFNNVSGIMGAQDGIALKGCKTVKFSNMALQDFFGTAVTQSCITLEDYSSSYITEDIDFSSVSFLKNESAGTFPSRFIWSKVALGNIGNYPAGFLTIRDVKTESTNAVFEGNLPRGGLKVSGLDSLLGNRWKFRTDGPTPEFFMFYERNTLQMRMHDSVSLSGVTTYPTFPNMWYWAPEAASGSGGSATRNPSVTIYRERGGNFMPLLYNVHWFIDSSSDGKMWDRIRMINPSADTQAADVIHILRHA